MDFPQQFFTLGMQYYVAGRSAALMKLIPVSGNLLHHAVEMLLKGDLSVEKTPEELKTKARHKLPTLWDMFKERHVETDPSVDHVIKELHAFEDIRYPNRIVAEGASMSVGIGGSAFLYPDESSRPREPSYTIDVSDVDRLVSIIFDFSTYKLEFFKAKLTSDAKQILTRGNTWLR